MAREHFYDRVPTYLRDTLPEDVWWHSQHNAGLMLHFYSNTQELRLRQKNRFNTHMPHMTGTGSRGADLYVKRPGQTTWKWAGVSINFVHGKKLLGKDNEATVDGIHYTDIGFKRYADALLPLLQKILE